MRKFAVLSLVAIASLIAFASIAGAQTFPPGQGPDDVYVGGTVVVSDPSAVSAVQVGGTQVSNLAFTGSSNTPSLILVGFAAVAVGLVMFVATRRRQTVVDRV